MTAVIIVLYPIAGALIWLRFMQWDIHEHPTVYLEKTTQKEVFAYIFYGPSDVVILLAAILIWPMLVPFIVILFLFQRVQNVVQKAIMLILQPAINFEHIKAKLLK